MAYESSDGCARGAQYDTADMVSLNIHNAPNDTPKNKLVRTIPIPLFDVNAHASTTIIGWKYCANRSKRKADIMQKNRGVNRVSMK